MNNISIFKNELLVISFFYKVNLDLSGFDSEYYILNEEIILVLNKSV